MKSLTLLFEHLFSFQLGADIWRSLRYAVPIFPISAVYIGDPRFRRWSSRLITWGAFAIIAYNFINPNYSIIGFVVPAIVSVFVVVRVFGDGWLAAPRLAGVLARERQNASFDLVSLTPLGEIGAAWVICASYLNRHARGAPLRTPRRLPLIGRLPFWLQRIIIYLAFAALLAAMEWYFLLAWLPDISLLRLLVSFVSTLAFVIAFSLEFDHTAAVGAVIGMLVPTFSLKPSEARIFALFAFLFIQIMNYGLIFILGFVLLPRLNVEWLFSGLAYSLSIPVLRLIIYYVIRQRTLFVLWAWLYRRSRADQSELDLAARLLRPSITHQVQG